jgi:homoserine O-acetyltransferase
MPAAITEPATDACTDAEAVDAVEHRTGVLTLPEFSFECGATLFGVKLRYETWGRLNPSRDNVVVVCHALTGDAHVGHGENGPGWWDGLVGPGRLIDTHRYFVVASNVLGGCAGSTGPSSPAPDGRPYALRFPLVSVRDMVRAQVRLLDALGVREVQLVIGGSLGGMQAWEWPLVDPDRVRHAVVIAADATFSALAIGYNEVMRQAIVGDPNWRHGDYYHYGVRPSHGLGLARAIAMLTYRTDRLYEARFGRERITNEPTAAFCRDTLPAAVSSSLAGESAVSEPDYDGPPVWDWSSSGDPRTSPYTAFTRPQFQVESYLRHHAKKLDARFDANSYLYLTRAMDSHDIGRGRGGLRAALERMRAGLTLVAIDSDYLYPAEALRRTADLAQTCGIDCEYRVLHSDFGHDAFLAEQGPLAELLRGALPA